MIYNRQINFVSPELGDKKYFQDYIEKITVSGQFSNNGPLLRELEQKISNRWGGTHLSMCSSATTGLLAVLCKIKNDLKKINQPRAPRNKVALCGYGWPSSVQCPELMGFSVELVDTRQDYPIFDWSKFIGRINEEYAAVIVTNTFGFPSFDLSHSDFLRSKGIKLICDAAHCFDVKNLFSPEQIIADFLIVSTHATKLFQTAEGGLVVSKVLEDKVEVDQILNFNLENSHRGFALNGKMSELNAALGLSQLPDLENIINLRLQNARNLFELIAKKGGFKWLKLVSNLLEDENWNGCYFPLVFQSRSERDKSYNNLIKNNIIARKYFDFILSDFSTCKVPLPNSRSFSNKICCLPIHHKIESDDIEHMTQIITSYSGDE